MEISFYVWKYNFMRLGWCNVHAPVNSVYK